MIEHQYNETVVIKRLADVVDTNKREFSTHIAAVSCCIQPLDQQISADIEGGFGKDFLMFCGTEDIAEGDRVIRTVNATEKEYRVTGVESFDFMGNPHMEISIRIFES